MEFAFTDEQAMIGETVRALFADNATSKRTRAALPGTGANAGLTRALWTVFAGELGLAGVGLPREDGGAGSNNQIQRNLIAERGLGPPREPRGQQ